MSDILRTVRRTLHERAAVDGWRVERLTVGDAAVLVELAERDGSATAAGLAHRPPGDVDTLPTDPTDPETLLDLLDGDAGEATWLARAVGIAALNALSAPLLDWATGDPMATLGADVATVVTVGLFRPAFRKFADVTVRVVERERVDADAVTVPEGVAVEAYRPAEAQTAMAGADVVFVTGSTLVYGGVERYLRAAPAAATTVVIGATASLLPDPLFDDGADVVAGAAVDDPAAARDAVRAGACGTDLHDHGVRKGYVTNATPTGLDLNS